MSLVLVMIVSSWLQITVFKKKWWIPIIIIIIIIIIKVIS